MGGHPAALRSGDFDVDGDDFCCGSTGMSPVPTAVVIAADLAAAPRFANFKRFGNSLHWVVGNSELTLRETHSAELVFYGGHVLRQTSVHDEINGGSPRGYLKCATALVNASFLFSKQLSLRTPRRVNWSSSYHHIEMLPAPQLD